MLGITLTLITNSFFCVGLKFLTSDGELLSWFFPNSDGDGSMVMMGIRLGEYNTILNFTKPINGCLACMASAWGLTYGFFLTPFVAIELSQTIGYLITLCGLNFFMGMIWDRLM